MGKIDFRFEFDSSGYIANCPQGIVPASPAFLEFYDIQSYTYYTMPTPDQAQMYMKVRETGQISFPFRTISSKEDVITSTVYDQDISVPSSVICQIYTVFNNKQQEHIQANSYEIDVGTNHYQKCGLLRPLINFNKYYVTIGENTFPNATGLLQTTPSSLKKYVENVLGKADKYSLR